MAINVHTEFSGSRRAVEQITIDDHCYAHSCGSSGSTVAPSEVSSNHSSSPRQVQALEDTELEVCGALARQTCVIADEPLQEMFTDSDDDDAHPTSPSKSARRRLRRKRQRDALRAAATGSTMEQSGAGSPRSPTATQGKSGLQVDTRCSAALDTSRAQFATHAPSLYTAPANALHSPTVSPVRTAVMSTSTCSPTSLASPLADASTRPVPPRLPMSTCPGSPTSWTSPLADASTRPVPPRTPVNVHCSGTMTPLGSAGVCLMVLSPNTPMTPVGAIAQGAVTPVSIGQTITPVAAESPPTPVTNMGSPNMPEMLKMLAGTTRVPTWGEIAYNLQAAAPEIYED